MMQYAKHKRAVVKSYNLLLIVLTINGREVLLMNKGFSQ
jgi:hypothetical protein